jgi:hypothetical protein
VSTLLLSVYKLFLSGLQPLNVSMNAEERTPNFDLIILGGGLAGTATALSLRQHNPSLSAPSDLLQIIRSGAKNTLDRPIDIYFSKAMERGFPCRSLFSPTRVSERFALRGDPSNLAKL